MSGHTPWSQIKHKRRRDLRDPSELGRLLLGGSNTRQGLSYAYDRYAGSLSRIRDYDHNPGPIEKYGDPRKIPSTMPNAVE